MIPPKITIKKGLNIRDEDEKKQGLEVLYMGDPVDEYKKYYEQFDKYKKVIGESIAQVSSIFYLETMRKKSLEVLYMVDPVDEYAVQQLK
eukprot:16433102-Heterocapsa_arctica.AAC.1